MDSKTEASGREKDVTTAKESDTKPQQREKKTFECSACHMSEKYDYFGKNPPFCKSIVFVDESYVMRDPFTSSSENNMNFLLLGSNCAICNSPVCQECSLFYTRRICSKCSQEKKMCFRKNYIKRKLSHHPKNNNHYDTINNN